MNGNKKYIVNKKIDRFCNIFAKRRTKFCQPYVAFSALAILNQGPVINWSDIFVDEKGGGGKNFCAL